VSCCLDAFPFAQIKADCRRPLHCSHTHLAAELESRSLEYEWWFCSVRLWNGLAALATQHLYKRRALDACRAAITVNVQNWACAMFKGILAMTYDMVIIASDMVHLDVQGICQLLD
jgi:hypothetical protein